MSFIPDDDNFAMSMKYMDRPLKSPPEKFPKHTVPNTIVGKHGITFSLENKEDQFEGIAEYNVLKAILNRENFLEKLQKVARTVGKKFKPEVADILDYVRAASLDVVDMILRWREAKGDHDAAFLWNGVNYLLKMPSDLDYLVEYLAIRRWMGFDLARNPFCVPFPMERSASQNASESLTNPQYIDKGRSTDGFVIGGMTQAGLQKKYATATTFSKSSKATSTTSPYGSGPSPVVDRAGKSSGVQSASVVMNSDMSKVRQAELVLLREEEKFGVLCKDPDGRIMPRLQALTRQAHVELKKDDRRPLAEPAQTMTYAPHAASSDVGVAEPNWTPENVREDQKSSAQTAEARESHFLEEVDDSVLPRNRGVGKVGGSLAAIQRRGADSRGRRPLKTNLSSDMEFKRHRQIRTLGDKIAEINRLREDLVREKLRLLEGDGQTGKSTLRPLSRGSDAAVPLSGRRLDVLRSSVSNHTYSPSGRSRKEVHLMRSGSAGEQKHAGDLNPGAAADRLPSLGGVPSKVEESPLRGIRKHISVDGAAGVAFGEGEEPPSPLGIEERRISPKISFRKAPSLSKSGSSKLINTSQKRLNVADATESAELLGSELRRLDKEQIEASQKLHHFVQNEEKVVALKNLEKAQTGRERSRDIERKRRLLSEKEGRRVGPPPEDHHNVYDYYAIRVQSVIRGFIARCWIRWYISVSLKACHKLQAVMRGWFGRMRVRRLRRNFHAARTIQRNFRGWSTRGTSSAMAKKQNMAKNAIVIQRVWRGILGVRRCISKRALDVAAKAAFECVDAKSISVGDVKELARRILYAIEEPSATTFPPDEVLHLIRLTTMVIQSARGTLGIAGYDFFNARHYDELGGEELSWMQAAKMVNRSERFMRLVRVMAYGPGAKPPRLVQLPNNASLLYAAQAQNPRWTLSTFQNMGMGSKICCQLFQWLTSIIEIAGRQQEFLSLIATSFPDWLPKLFDLQKMARIGEFEIELNKKCMSVLELFKARSAEDDTLLSVLDKEMLLVKRASNDARGRMKDTLVEIEKLKSDQSSREVFALLALEQKAADNNQELDEMAKTFQQTFRLAGQGDRAAIEALPELKINLTNQRLKVTELDGQRKLLEMQVEMNRTKRKNPAKLSPEITFKTLLAGEAKAAYIVAQVRAKTMLRSSGVKHASDLPMHLVDLYEGLAAEEERCRAEARKLFVEAETERKLYDDVMARSLSENEVKEQKSRDKMSPTEQELLEERCEDEAEARAERLKHKQYLPDSVLLVHPPRPQPVVLALSRDLPLFVKERIHAEVTRMMPGVFVTVDHSANMGIDFMAMQTVLDAGKCILMHVDPGLTRVTRDSFLQNFEINIKALVPSPVVALAIGDELNQRGGCGDSEWFLGVSKTDLSSLRDGALKTSLESMAWVANQIGTQPSVWALFQKRAAELVPHSKSFVFVLEALFVVLSGEDTHKSPDDSLAAVTWRATRKLLVEPRNIAATMKKYRRGSASTHMVEVIRKYLQHRLWPEAFGAERSVDVATNLLASYVEQWEACERASKLGDGVPLHALTKSTMKGFQSVVVVSDSSEPDDSIQDQHQPSQRVTWRTAVAQLVRAAVQNSRVLKSISKIDGELHHVSVYRESSAIYLEAYHPITSALYVTQVSVQDVPALLIPNGFGISSGTAQPPDSPLQMYQAMVRLLRFDKLSKQKATRKQLICRREQSFLCNVTRKVSGHSVMLKCYEAALGELFFTAYIPQFSAHVSLLVGDDVRLGLLRNADSGETLEHEFVDGEDARPLLPFVLDRLRLSPSKAMLHAVSLDLNDGFRPNQGLRSDVLRQGFRLKVRTHGGVGRPLLRKVQSFNGVPHLMELRSSSHTKTLLLSLYEPRKRHTMCLSISAFLRKTLLSETSDDYRRWLGDLLQRVRVSWRGVHSLTLDTCIFRAGKKIGAEHMVMRFLVDGPDSLRVTLFHPIICEYFSCLLSVDQIGALLSFQSPLSELSRVSGQTIIPPAVQSILQQLVMFHSATEPSAQVIDHNPLESVFNSKAVLAHLANQLEQLLEPVDPSKLLFGFTVRRGPLMLDLALDSSLTDRSAALDTSLRYVDHLQQMPRDGSLAGVLRSRRQAPVVDMERELDDLALRKSREANQLVVHHEAIARTLSAQISALDEGELEKIIEDATAATASALLNSIHNKQVERFAERNVPGLHQEAFEDAQAALTQIPSIPTPDLERAAILGKEWRLVLEIGVKTNFREGKVRWHGHVSVKVSETVCWDGDAGIGKRYRFEVYEPKVAQTFEGVIRSKKHLTEILGLHGQDLAQPDRAKEMLLFVCKQRMDVVVNKKTWDGEDVAAGAPPYRIEFQSDRLYSNEKVTPVNAGGEEDEEANKDKLIDMDNARGKKVVRLVRRVSGLLMQLTVFDIPEAIVAASEQQRLMALAGSRNETSEVGALQRQSSFVEDREEVKVLERFSPPAFRIVGYDPRSKRKVTLTVEPQAIVEVCGGVFSPYLHPERKKDLAKVVCDALVLLFPSGRPFEMMVPWSGAKKEASTATVSAGDTKLSMRSSAERVVKRSGRLFRSAMRISKYDLVVSLYSLSAPASGAGESVHNRSLVFNFYSPAVSEASEVVVTEAEQVARVERAILSYSEGAIRAAAIRRLCKFFRCEIVEDVLDPKVKTMHIVLLPPGRGFVTDYQQISVPTPGDDLRPVGIPAVFFPLDTCGRVVHRRGMSLRCRDKKQPAKDFLVTVYTKSENENPERGLVVKLYDRGLSVTSILHLGASELMRLCEQCDEPDLLRDMVQAQLEESADSSERDEIETGFADITVKGELEAATKRLENVLVDIVLNDLGYLLDAQDAVVPYLRSAPRGIPPS